MKEFKAFYKVVEGKEGERCHYSTRLDTYGCGCFHNCKYCYAKSLLAFRGLWNPEEPSVADIKKIEKKIKTLKKGSVVRLGGMTDCFQPCEEQHNVTYNTIKLLNERGVHYLIVTKSDLIATDKYMKILDKNLAHIQITVTSTDDKIAAQYENATPPTKRIKAIEKLGAEGFDVAIRISPFIPEFINFETLNKIKCKKAIVEFLRVNAFIKRTFNLDYSLYTHKEGGYYHLPLETKKKLLKKITGFEQISVCEDCSEAYNYWKSHVNYNPSDCCNLSFNSSKSKYIGNLKLLKNTKYGFLSSQKYCPGTSLNIKNWLKTLDPDVCVVSGFQSKLEKELLDFLLQEKRKIIFVLSTDVYEKCPQKFKEAVKNGSMLIISPFDTQLRIKTRNAAKTRNKFIIEMVDKLFIGDLTSNGMLDTMLKDKTYCLIGEKT